jgi:hypothetical protein
MFFLVELNSFNHLPRFVYSKNSIDWLNQFNLKIFIIFLTVKATRGPYLCCGDCQLGAIGFGHLESESL